MTALSREHETARFTTRLVHVAATADAHRTALMPIYPTSTFGNCCFGARAWSRPEVAWVRRSGPSSHPQDEQAKRQTSGAGAVISFEMKVGFDSGSRLLARSRLTTLAVSMGGVETLMEQPAAMTFAKMASAGVGSIGARETIGSRRRFAPEQVQK